MIGIKGIAKKPITDATASSENVVNGKIFYNNNGRQSGTLNTSSLLYSRSISLQKGTYTDKTMNAKHQYSRGSFLRTTIQIYTGHGTFAVNTIDVDQSSIINGPYGGSGLYSGDVILASGVFNDLGSYVPCGIEYWSSDSEKYKFLVSPGSYTTHEIDAELFVKANLTYNDCGQSSSRDVDLQLYFGNNYYIIASKLSNIPTDSSAYSITVEKAVLSSNISINFLFYKI